MYNGYRVIYRAETFNYTIGVELYEVLERCFMSAHTGVYDAHACAYCGVLLLYSERFVAVRLKGWSGMV